MKLLITIELDNAAFELNPEHEIKAILLEYLKEWQPGLSETKLRDLNGNTVGSAVVTE